MFSGQRVSDGLQVIYEHFKKLLRDKKLSKLKCLRGTLNDLSRRCEKVSTESDSQAACLCIHDPGRTGVCLNCV